VQTITWSLTFGSVQDTIPGTWTTLYWKVDSSAKTIFGCTKDGTALSGAAGTPVGSPNEFATDKVMLINPQIYCDASEAGKDITVWYDYIDWANPPAPVQGPDFTADATEAAARSVQVDFRKAEFDAYRNNIWGGDELTTPDNKDTVVRVKDGALKVTGTLEQATSWITLGNSWTMLEPCRFSARDYKGITAENAGVDLTNKIVAVRLFVPATAPAVQIRFAVQTTRWALCFGPLQEAKSGEWTTLYWKLDSSATPKQTIFGCTADGTPLEGEAGTPVPDTTDNFSPTEVSVINPQIYCAADQAREGITVWYDYIDWK
jgi:hypothetical protein